MVVLSGRIRILIRERRRSRSMGFRHEQLWLQLRGCRGFAPRRAPRRSRLIAIVCAASLVLLLVAVSDADALTAGPQLTPPIPRTTHVRFFEPYSRSGKLVGVRIAGYGSGYCWTASYAVHDPNAWRCNEGNLLLDPCFSRPGYKHPASVACGSPWSGVRVLRLTKPLPITQANTNIYPVAGWLLELSNGKHCSLVQGGAPGYAGVLFAYYCGGSTWASPNTVQLRLHMWYSVLRAEGRLGQAKQRPAPV